MLKMHLNLTKGLALSANDLTTLTAEEPIVLISRCKSGLETTLFEELAACLDLPDIRLADILHIPKSTLIRRKREGKLSFEESERLYRIVRLYQMASDLLGSPDNAREWLNAPLVAFGGKTPLEFADSDLGVREVEAVLDRIADGVIF